MFYPDWVLIHKETGIYVQKKNEHTCRIYRGYDERPTRQEILCPVY